MYSYSKFEHHYAKSFFKYEEPVSKDYRVFVNGEEIPVYTCRISAYPFNRVWTGFQRPVDQTEIASYVNLASDEKLTIEVETCLAHDRVLIKPYSKNIRHVEENGRIRFELTENGQFVLECGSYHHCLYIFNSKPIAAPSPEEVTYYFGPDIHFPGKIVLKSNESVYIDQNALVFGCIYAENAENIHVFGNGILDDSHEERTGNYCYENYTNGNIKFYECSHVRVEGVGMTNSAIWCCNLFACSDVRIRDMKIFGQWRYNTDGVDIVNSRDIFIQDSFVHSFDDTITIKGIDRYNTRNNENIYVDGCVLWCDWGRCCEIGVETLCREYKNIRFTNCDILRGGLHALAVENGDQAEMSNIVFSNIRVEYNRFDTQEQYQDTDETRYNRQNTMAIPTLLEIVNPYWRNPECRAAWGIPEPDFIDMTGLTPNLIHDVQCRDITVYYDEGLPLQDGKPVIPVVVKSDYEDAQYYNIVLSNVRVNGQKWERSDFALIEENVLSMQMIDLFALFRPPTRSKKRASAVLCASVNEK